MYTLNSSVALSGNLSTVAFMPIEPVGRGCGAQNPAKFTILVDFGKKV